MSARNPHGSDIKVVAPTRGLVTRIPSDQPSEKKTPGSWTVAQNVRFDDGVARNAPGYRDIVMHEKPETQILGIFQEQIIETDRPVFNNPIIITQDKIYYVQRRTYAAPDILVESIDSAETVSDLVLVTDTNGYIRPDPIDSEEFVSDITLS